MTDADDLLAELDAADEEYREYVARVEDHGEAQIEAVADAHRRATDLMDRYASRATGTGDFQAFVEFQGKFTDLVEGLPDDLPHRDAFERADDRFDKRRLSEDDFARVREILAPAAELGRLLDERQAARERYRAARNDVGHYISSLRERIDDRERLLELADADFDAPVEELREPIEAYNDAVADAFATFKGEASAREVVDFLDSVQAYPLVEFRAPPADLRTYVHEYEAGTETIPDLLAYAGYSQSKLDHYVEDAMALKRRVATQETYLSRLDAAPLQLSWPPRPAAELRWRIPELVRVLDRFAPPEPVERLREIRTLARDEDSFERLRTTAVARERLTDDERRRLANGDVEAELQDLRAARDRLEDALAEYPDR